MCEVTAQELL